MTSVTIFYFMWSLMVLWAIWLIIADQRTHITWTRLLNGIKSENNRRYALSLLEQMPDGTYVKMRRAALFGRKPITATTVDVQQAYARYMEGPEL